MAVAEDKPTQTPGFKLEDLGLGLRNYCDVFIALYEPQGGSEHVVV